MVDDTLFVVAWDDSAGLDCEIRKPFSPLVGKFFCLEGAGATGIDIEKMID
jgi:hypothetical protein